MPAWAVPCACVGLDADGRIGNVVVGGDWVTSDLIAGVLPGGDAMFGTSDDIKIADLDDLANVQSRIASIVIKGQVFGTAHGTDGFGFVAQQIGAFSVGGTKLLLASGAANDDLDANDPLLSVGTTGDVRVHEAAL